MYRLSFFSFTPYRSFHMFQPWFRKNSFLTQYTINIYNIHTPFEKYLCSILIFPRILVCTLSRWGFLSIFAIIYNAPQRIRLRILISQGSNNIHILFIKIKIFLSRSRRHLLLKLMNDISHSIKTLERR